VIDIESERARIEADEAAVGIPAKAPIIEAAPVS
jgi:hypothetical protein